MGREFRGFAGCCVWYVASFSVSVCVSWFCSVSVVFSAVCSFLLPVPCFVDFVGWWLLFGVAVVFWCVELSLC